MRNVFSENNIAFALKVANTILIKKNFEFKKKRDFGKTLILGLCKFSNLSVLHKGLLLQAFRLGI